jgi:uncharacterized repeat protein (TIGR03803 family)
MLPKLSIMLKTLIAMIIGCLVYSVRCYSDIEILHEFQRPGIYPQGGLIEGSDGTLYGTTREGGLFNQGTIFKRHPGGTLSSLHNFKFEEGANPFGSIVLGSDNAFYGMTASGGVNGAGTIYRFEENGDFRLLHSFSMDDGYILYGSSLI